MSGVEERLGALTDAVLEQLAAGREIDTAARADLASRFDVEPADVELCIEGARVFDDLLAEPEHPSLGVGRPTVPADFELGEELGRGGMGVVYRARQRSLDRDVALKILDPGNLVFGATLQRFQREARSLARMRHPHIVSIHEVGDAGGFVYFTMDLVDGKPLSALMRRRKPLPASRTVRLMRQVCSAMVYAHGQGLIHRDLKPANILVAEGEDGQENAFVVDFGLARDVTSVASHTVTGEALGTPGYMSPEQALGDGDRIDERTDVYALGVILYECLTGRAPFAHLPLARMLHAVVEESPEPIRARQSSVPGDLATIAHRAMAKDVNDRYATVQALDEDLARFERGEAVVARGPSVWRRLRGGWRRHQRAVLFHLAVVYVIATFTVQWVGPWARDEGTIEHAKQLLRADQSELALGLFEEVYGIEPQGDLGADAGWYASVLIKEGARAQLIEGQRLRAADLFARASRMIDRDPSGSDGYNRRCLLGFGIGEGELDGDLARAVDGLKWGESGGHSIESLPALLRFATDSSMDRWAVPDALAYLDRLPVAARDVFAQRCLRRPWAVPPVSGVDAAFEKALVAHIQSGEESRAILAAGLLDVVAPIPLLPRVEVDGEWRVATHGTARAVLLADWRRLGAATRATRHLVAVEILVRTLRDGVGAGHDLEGRALAAFAESFRLLTGRWFDPDDSIEPNDWEAAFGLAALRDRLGLDEGLDLTRPEALAAAGAVATPEVREHLLALTYLMASDDFARPLAARSIDGGLRLDTSAWPSFERVLPDVLQLAAFRFVNGRAKPIGVWGATVSAAPMASVEWTIVSREPSWPEDWHYGPWLGIQRTVDESGEQAVRSAASMFFLGTGRQFLGQWHSEVRPGVPTLVGRVEGRDGSKLVTDVFVALRTARDAVPLRSWGEWQRLLTQGIDPLARGLGSPSGTAQRSVALRDLSAIGLAATVLAAPHASEPLERLAQVVREQEIDAPWLPWARLLAGDADALALAIPDGAGLDPGMFAAGADRAWLRIGRSNLDPAILDATAVALQGADPVLQQLLVDLPTIGPRFAARFPAAWWPASIGLRWIPLLAGALLALVMVRWRRTRSWLAPTAGLLAFALLGGVAAQGFAGRWAGEVQLAVFAVAALVGWAVVHGRSPVVSLGITVWTVAALLGATVFENSLGWGSTVVAAGYTMTAMLVADRKQAREAARKERLWRRRRVDGALDGPLRVR